MVFGPDHRPGPITGLSIAIILLFVVKLVFKLRPNLLAFIFHKLNFEALMREKKRKLVYMEISDWIFRADFMSFFVFNKLRVDGFLIRERGESEISLLDSN